MSLFFSLFSHFRLNRFLLLLGSGTASVVFIILKNIGALPLDSVTFFFFSFILFLFSLYRPGWVFLLFIGVLPLESVNLAPAAFGGLMLRPYQWLTGVLLLAVGIRFISGRLPFRMFQPRFFDAFPLVMTLGAFLGLFWAPIPTLALKQALVVMSFASVYFLGRIFLRTLYDVRQTIPFFLVSSSIVFGYALWQNVRFLFGQVSFQVMAGRPNGTFEEADWLGMFTLLAFGVALALLARTLHFLRETTEKTKAVIQLTGTVFFLTLTFVVLIITVARSAWLGAVVLMLVFVSGLLFRRGISSFRKSFRKMFSFFFLMTLSFLLASGAVWGFHLSPFQFLNRIQSTGSGWQKITVSCFSADTALPQKLSDMSELALNGCRHILLEEIGQEERAGRFVQEVYRPDPNVSIRQEIYGKVWSIGKKHPFAGIGFGSISSFLGTDERGMGLNASNIFFEVWLGSGLMGLLALSIFLCLLVFRSWQWYREATEVLEYQFALFLLATLFGLTVFNLFNSGLLLGFFFAFLSFGALALERKTGAQSRKEVFYE